MHEINDLLLPGMLVRNPAAKEWGIGQVQSNIAGKITVNFRERGKVVIVGDHVPLEMVTD